MFVIFKRTTKMSLTIFFASHPSLLLSSCHSMSVGGVWCSGKRLSCRRRSNRRWHSRVTSVHWMSPASRPRCLERTAVWHPTAQERPSAALSSQLSVS